MPNASETGVDSVTGNPIGVGERRHAHDVIVGTIEVQDGPDVELYQNHPGGKALYRTLCPRVVLHRIPVYNVQERQISFRIEFGSLGNKTPNLQPGFGLEDYTGTPAPMECEYCEVILAVGNDERVVHKENSFRSNGKISVSHTVDDQRLHAALMNEPQSVVVKVIPYYRFEVYRSEEASWQITSQATKKVIETVIGDAHAGLVTRDVKNELLERMSTQLTVAFDENAPDLAADLIERAHSAFSDFKPLSNEEVIGVGDQLYYGPENARLELAPRMIKHRTDSLTTHEKFRSVLDTAWNIIRKVAKATENAREFYKEIKHDYDHKGDHGGKFDVFEVISGGGHHKVDQDANWSELKSETQKHVEQVWKDAQTEGSIKQEYVEDIYENWTGERFVEDAEAKPIKIFRIERANLMRSLREVATRYKALSSRVTPIPVHLSLEGETSIVSIGSIVHRLRELANKVDSFTTNGVIKALIEKGRFTQDHDVLYFPAIETDVLNANAVKCWKIFARHRYGNENVNAWSGDVRRHSLPKKDHGAGTSNP